MITISKENGLIQAISTYGDKHVAEKVNQNQELTELMNRIYNNMSSLKKDNFFDLEEALTEYTARAITLAYMTGFKDCMGLRESLDEMT